MSYDFKKALRILEDTNDNYWKKYPIALEQLRKYTGTLIFNKENSVKDRLEILAFIESKFNNDSRWFFKFIKSLNKSIENSSSSEKNVEEVLKEQLWYKWEWIFNDKNK